MLKFLKGLAAKAHGAGLVSIFNSILLEIKSAPPAVQKQVAEKVIRGLEPFLLAGNESFAKAMLPILAGAASERTHAAMASGANSGRDPAYAEAALLHAWFVAAKSENQDIFGPINESLTAWLRSTGVEHTPSANSKSDAERLREMRQKDAAHLDQTYVKNLKAEEIRSKSEMAQRERLEIERKAKDEQLMLEAQERLIGLKTDTELLPLLKPDRWRTKGCTLVCLATGESFEPDQVRGYRIEGEFYVVESGSQLGRLYIKAVHPLIRRD